MEPVPESSREGESSEATLLDDFTTLSPQRQVIRGQSHTSSEHMEQCSSYGNSHPLNMASPPIPSEFNLLVVSPNFELQERNYLGNNAEPSSVESFPSPTLGLVIQEVGQSSHQAEIISTRHNQPETRGFLDGDNTSGQQAWQIGGNHSPIPRPQNLFPHNALGLGVEHGGNDFDQTSPSPRAQTPFPHNELGLRVGHGGNDFNRPIPQPQTPFPYSALGLEVWHGGNDFYQSLPISRPQTPFPHSALGLGVGHGGNDFDQTLPIPRPQTPLLHGAMGLGVGHGGNDFDQSLPIPQPQTPFPHSALGLGVGHGGSDFDWPISRPQTQFSHNALELRAGHGGNDFDQTLPISQPQTPFPNALGLGVGHEWNDFDRPIPRPQIPLSHSVLGLGVGGHGGNDFDQTLPIPWPQTPLLHSAMGLGVGHGGNDFDQSLPIPQPQTPFPNSAMGLGVGHGGNDFDQTSQIPWPQTPFPHNMGLGGGHGGPHLTNQQQENWVTFNQNNPYQASTGTHQSISEAPSIPNVLHAQYTEAPIWSHQFFDESPIIPIALDAQYSSSVTPQQATPIWSHAMSRQQTNDQVLMDASNAGAHAAVNESMLLPETSVPYWQSLHRGQHVQPNRLPLLDVDPSHYSTMHETSMMIGPQYSASFQTVNQTPSVQNFVDNSNAGTVFLPAASSIPQRVPFTSPLGFPNESPPIIPNLNAGQSQFMNPEMDGGNYSIGNPYHLRTMDSYSEQGSRKRFRLGDSTYEEGQSSSSSAKQFRLDGITQEQNRPWLNLGHANSSSQPQGNNSGGIINRVYDPMYERLGLPIDPHLRMFLASQSGNPSSSRQTATLQSFNQPPTQGLLDKRS